jgi:hypothetical protein
VRLANPTKTVRHNLVTPGGGDLSAPASSLGALNPASASFGATNGRLMREAASSAGPSTSGNGNPPSGADPSARTSDRQTAAASDSIAINDTTGGSNAPDDLYSVSISRGGDRSGDSELYGTYPSRPDAEKAVKDIKEWAAKTNDPDWKVTGIEISSLGAPAKMTGSPDTGAVGFNEAAKITDPQVKPNSMDSSGRKEPLMSKSVPEAISNAGDGMKTASKFRADSLSKDLGQRIRAAEGLSPSEFKKVVRKAYRETTPNFNRYKAVAKYLKWAGWALTTFKILDDVFEAPWGDKMNTLKADAAGEGAGYATALAVEEMAQPICAACGPAALVCEGVAAVGSVVAGLVANEYATEKVHQGLKNQTGQ